MPEYRIFTTQAPPDPNVRFASPGNLDPYARLMAGICRQALYDVRAGHEDAAEWLKSEDAEAYFEILGVDLRVVQAYLNKRFPPDVLQ